MGIPELLTLALMIVIPVGLVVFVARSLQKAAASRETSRVTQLERRVAELEAQQKRGP